MVLDFAFFQNKFDVELLAKINRKKKEKNSIATEEAVACNFSNLEKRREL